MTEIDGMPDTNAPKPVLKVRPCEACGGLPHGSASLELACFRLHLRGARLQVLSPEELAEWNSWKMLQKTVKRLPASTIHLRGK